MNWGPNELWQEGYDGGITMELNNVHGTVSGGKTNSHGPWEIQRLEEIPTKNLILHDAESTKPRFMNSDLVPCFHERKENYAKASVSIS